MLQTQGDAGSIPGPGSSPGEGNDNPLQYSWASLVAQMVKNNNNNNKSDCNAGALEGMATHSSILAWKIPWMEESGGPQSMGSQRGTQD